LQEKERERRHHIIQQLSSHGWDGGCRRLVSMRLKNHRQDPAAVRENNQSVVGVRDRQEILR